MLSAGRPTPRAADQFYVTHCAKSDSVLNLPGYSVRATSTPNDQAGLIRAIEYPPYELPINMWKDRPTKAQTPRRLARTKHPAGGVWVCHSVYREEDTMGRDRSYFTHLIHLPVSTAPAAILRSWDAAGWKKDYSPKADKILPAGQLPVGTVISDAALSAFLCGQQIGPTDLAVVVCPLRFRPSAVTRRELVLKFLHGVHLAVHDGKGRNRLFVHAEPGLVAMLTYAAVRILPPSSMANLTFSTFEPAHRGLRDYNLATVVGTYLGERLEGLEPELTASRGYGLDTFNPERSSRELAEPLPGGLKDLVVVAANGEWDLLAEVHRHIGTEANALADASNLVFFKRAAIAKPVTTPSEVKVRPSSSLSNPSTPKTVPATTAAPMIPPGVEKSKTPLPLPSTSTPPKTVPPAPKGSGVRTPHLNPAKGLTPTFSPAPPHEPPPLPEPMPSLPIPPLPRNRRALRRAFKTGLLLFPIMIVCIAAVVFFWPNLEPESNRVALGEPEKPITPGAAANDGGVRGGPIPGTPSPGNSAIPPPDSSKPGPDPASKTDKPRPSPLPKDDVWIGEWVFPRSRSVSLQDDVGKKIGTWLMTAGKVTSMDKDRVLLRHNQGTGRYTGYAMKSEVVKLADAPGFFTARIQANEKDTWAMRHRAEAWRLKGEHDKAFEDYDKVIRIDGGPDNYTARGIAWSSRQEHDKAIKDFDKAIVLDPKYANAFYHRGDAWSARENHEKAIEDYDKAIDLAPEFAHAFNRRGFARSALKEFDKAIEDYQEAIRLDPEDAIAYNNLGNAWSSLKEYEKAIDNYDEAILLNPNDATFFYNRGLAWRYRDENDKAIKNYKAAIRLDANFTRAFYEMACCYALKGETASAIDNLQKCLELGYRDFNHLATDPDLVSIRDEERYKEVLKKYMK